MESIDINDFFKEFAIEETSQKTEIAKNISNILDACTRATGQSLYVIDYYEKGFLYVSSSPLFLSGYTVDEVKQMGYSFYEKILPVEDVKMLFEINKAGFKFFYSQPAEDRIKLTISYDFRMRYSQNRYLMINHKLTPIVLTPEGDIRIALCTVSLSSQSDSGHVFIRKEGSLERFIYSFESKKWSSCAGFVLSDREKEVLQLSTQGLSNDQIANDIFLDVNTVKFHKRNIYRKFGVKNITEAIIFAHNNTLL